MFHISLSWVEMAILRYCFIYTELQVPLNFLGPSCFMGKVTCLARLTLHWPTLGMWSHTCTARSHHEQLQSLGQCTKGSSRNQWSPREVEVAPGIWSSPSICWTAEKTSMVKNSFSQLQMQSLCSGGNLLCNGNITARLGYCGQRGSAGDFNLCVLRGRHHISMN